MQPRSYGPWPTIATRPRTDRRTRSRSNGTRCASGPTKNGVEIIHEFADAGKSGLNAEGRPAFTEMMDEWVKKRSDFDYMLCLDVSRWGRFQDIDLSAQYSAECKKHGKQVIYTTIGKPREDDPLYPVYVQFERFRAAQYSRELSDKVWRGCVKIAEQGYWAGGPPPYGLQRLLLDEKREPLHMLEPGQRKGIQNQRVTLVEGDPTRSPSSSGSSTSSSTWAIRNTGSPKGSTTTASRRPADAAGRPASVLDRLRNEKYVGTMVYNQTSQKLKTPRRPIRPKNGSARRRPSRASSARSSSLQAQEILEQRRQKYDPDHMLGQLDDALPAARPVSFVAACGSRTRSARRRHLRPPLRLAGLRLPAAVTANSATGPASWSTSRSASTSPRCCRTPTSWCWTRS